MSPLTSIVSPLSPAVHQFCHVRIISLNVNILAIATVKHLYDFFVWVHVYDRLHTSAHMGIGMLRRIKDRHRVFEQSF